MISVIIVNYGTGMLLPRLCNLLEREPLVNEIIIVDNLGDVPKDLPGNKIILLKNKVNRGFAKAVNQGAKIATQPWLLLLNPDVIPLPNSINSLYQGASSCGAALAGPRFFWDEEKTFKLPPATGYSLASKLIQAARVHETSPWDYEQVTFEWALRHDRFWAAEEPFWEPFLSGACMLIDRNKIPDPVLDERYFLYFEDADLCINARSKGLLIACIPEAEIVHFWSQSPDPDTPKGNLMAESERLFLEKHYGMKGLPSLLPWSQKETVLPNFVELETKNSPPVFDIGLNRGEEVNLEIGADMLFIPFAQAHVKTAAFSFPIKIWDRLPPGRYFTRCRTKTGYITGHQWTWIKK